MVDSTSNDPVAADTIALFSLINENVQSIFTNGILSLTDQQKADLHEVSKKFKELELQKVAEVIDEFLDNSNDRSAVGLIMRLFTINRLLERVYTREFLLKQLEDVIN
ncbi:MAG: hypothetical protein ACFFD4_27945 [Candidatus Odinarchaeota archaeon]